MFFTTAQTTQTNVGTKKRAIHTAYTKPDKAASQKSNYLTNLGLEIPAIDASKSRLKN